MKKSTSGVVCDTLWNVNKVKQIETKRGWPSQIKVAIEIRLSKKQANKAKLSGEQFETIRENRNPIKPVRRKLL